MKNGTCLDCSAHFGLKKRILKPKMETPVLLNLSFIRCFKKVHRVNKNRSVTYPRLVSRFQTWKNCLVFFCDLLFSSACFSINFQAKDTDMHLNRSIEAISCLPFGRQNEKNGKNTLYCMALSPDVENVSIYENIAQLSVGSIEADLVISEPCFIEVT